MKKSQLYVGIDLAKGPGHAINTEHIIRQNPDGTIEILSTHTWKSTIDLPKDAYRVRSANAPAQ